MNPHTTRGQLLLQHGRHDEAATMFRQALADDPDDAHAHTLLGSALLESTDRKQQAQAQTHLRRAITLSPEDPLAYVFYGDWLSRQGKLDEAVKATDAALRLDPQDADAYALRAQIELRRQRWNDALAWAEKGLAVDAEHTDCQNLRSLALTRMRLGDEAGASVRETLRQAPQDATAHANEGFRQLHLNQPKKALEHFREALRIEPGHEFAKAGLVEALKARNPIYRLLLGYFLWMASLMPRTRNFLLIGGFVAYRVLDTVAEQNPATAPYLKPLVWAYIAFALLTWVGVPMFNLLLRLSPYGRHALSRDQVLGSNVFGVMLLATLAAVGLAAAGVAEGFWTVALVVGLTTLPVSAWLQLRYSTRFTGVGVGTAAVVVLGVATIVDAFVPFSGGVFTAWLLTLIAVELFIVFGGSGHARG